MYHDIGKMENPRFFTENQVGEVSPHEDLSPEESAKIIIAHVIKGVEKAKEYKLPETVLLILSEPITEPLLQSYFPA